MTTQSKYSKDDSSPAEPKLSEEERDIARRLVSDPSDTAARSKFYKLVRYAMIRRQAGAPK